MGVDVGLQELVVCLARAAIEPVDATWSPDVAVRGDDLLGLVMAQRPSAKLVFYTPEGTIGLCLASGRVLAAAVEGKRLFDQAAIAEDKSLALVVDLWSEPIRNLGARVGMFADLGFCCEHDRHFARSTGFPIHVVSVLRELMGRACERVEISGHESSDYGLDLADMVVQTLRGLPSDERRRRIGNDKLIAQGGIPPWLRPALPPARFGRVFFDLADGATLQGLTPGRLDHEELDVAILAGLMGGLVERVERVVDPNAAPPQDTSDPARPTPAALPATKRRMGRPTTIQHTRPMGSPNSLEEVAVQPPLCGSSEGFFDLLGTLAAEGRKQLKRTRLTGTRFEPVGLNLGDLRAYYALGVGTFGAVQVALMAKGPLAGRIVAAKQLHPEYADKPEPLRRLRAEASLMSVMDHENLVRGLGTYTHDHEHFILMEFVHGVTAEELGATLRRTGKRLDERALRYIGTLAARGLAAFHDLVLPDGTRLRPTHGDITASSLLLGYGGEVKLGGISDACSDVAAYSPAGERPPQERRDHAVARDVSDLAGVLYELASGHSARGIADDNTDPHEVLPLHDLAPWLSRELADLIERAIHHRDHSFGSAQDFANAIAGNKDGDGWAELTHTLDELYGGHAARELEAVMRMNRTAPAPTTSATGFT